MLRLLRNSDDENPQLRGGGIAAEHPSRIALRAQKQIECDDVRNHQQGHVDDGNHVGRAQLAGQSWESDFSSVVIVEDEVDRTRLKAITNSQKIGLILTVNSASKARMPVAKSQ